MMDDFDRWWEKYRRVSGLNKIHLSFLDVDVLKAELRLAFYRKLPEPREASGGSHDDR